MILVKHMPLKPRQNSFWGNGFPSFRITSLINLGIQWFSFSGSASSNRLSGQTSSPAHFLDDRHSKNTLDDHAVFLCVFCGMYPLVIASISSLVVAGLKRLAVMTSFWQLMKLKEPTIAQLQNVLIGRAKRAPHGWYICDFSYIITSVDAGALLGASLREVASEAAVVCVHS